MIIVFKRYLQLKFYNQKWIQQLLDKNYDFLPTKNDSLWTDKQRSHSRITISTISALDCLFLTLFLTSFWFWIRDTFFIANKFVCEKTNDDPKIGWIQMSPDIFRRAKIDICRLSLCRIQCDHRIHFFSFLFNFFFAF